MGEISLHSDGPVACFLIINPIPKLSELALLSVIQTTDIPIAIGYLNDSDLPKLSNHPKVIKIKLDLKSNPLLASKISAGVYQDFSQDFFYQLVQYKWVLFSELLSMGYSTIFYSDVDVVWLKDPVEEIIDTFTKMPEVHWLMQSFTSSTNHPKLCMGFAAFKNSEIVKDFIRECAQEHAVGLKLNPKLGDDDVVTKMYQILNYPRWLRELPQATFPVGSMLNLYSKRNLFPGLNAPDPYIFHANYVVGIKNKLLLLARFLDEKETFNIGLRMSLKSRMTLMLKAMRLRLFQIKKSFFS